MLCFQVHFSHYFRVAQCLSQKSEQLNVGIMLKDHMHVKLRQVSKLMLRASDWLIFRRFDWLRVLQCDSVNLKTFLSVLVIDVMLVISQKFPFNAKVAMSNSTICSMLCLEILIA